MAKKTVQPITWKEWTCTCGHVMVTEAAADAPLYCPVCKGTTFTYTVKAEMKKGKVDHE